MRLREDLVIRPRDLPPCLMANRPPTTGQPPAICGLPATRRVISGCRHEHMAEGDLCDKHAERALGGFIRQFCWPCRELGHDCELKTKEIHR